MVHLLLVSLQFMKRDLLRLFGHLQGQKMTITIIIVWWKIEILTVMLIVSFWCIFILFYINVKFCILDGLHKDPIFTWSGQLPKIVHSSPTYSCKVFLGGVPWDITEDGLIMAFSKFGSIKVEWPGTSTNINQPKGYVYIIMQSDQMVKQLLESCTSGGNYYFKISSRKMKGKEVQVIPWLINDSNYVKHPSQKLDPTRTVFVGALHGMMNAQGLFKIMDDLFGNVSYAGMFQHFYILLYFSRINIFFRN